MSTLSEAIRTFRKKAKMFRDSIGNERFPAMQGPYDPKMYSIEKTQCNGLAFPYRSSPAKSQFLKSGFCTKEQLESPAFRYWALQIRERWRLHRKIWEFCFILQSLYERGMLQSGTHGLGFAVGEEPLPSLMASMGCHILATDLDEDDPRATHWANTHQLVSNVAKLNQRKICPDQEFLERVSYLPVDMNAIPNDLTDFDFSWSSCSFEHCGSIDLGKKFLQEQMKCLKPGGISVHTTEFNLTSNTDTIEVGPTVIFRRQDVESIIRDLRGEGHRVELLQIDLGDSKEDLHIDTLPYDHDLHLKLNLYDVCVSTSVGLIIEKGG